MVQAIRGAGFTHIVWLPDSETGHLYRALLEEPGLTLVPVAREGEAIPIAAGLWAGGCQPLVVMQSTGFFESGDSLRGLALDTALPLVLMIGYRGYDPGGRPADSAAVFLEPLLQAWGITYYLVRGEGDLALLPRALKEAEGASRPVALLICGEYR